MSPYPAKDMLERLQEAKTLHDGIQKFFRYNCEFWRVLEKYIDHCEIGHCPFVELDYPIRHGRGIPGIRWKEVYPNPVGAGEDAPNVIRVCFTVDMWDEEEDRERGTSGMVDVPIKLITHFDQKKFDEWIKGKEKRHSVRRVREAKEELEVLQAKYPEVLEEEAVLPLLNALGLVLAVHDSPED